MRTREEIEQMLNRWDRKNEKELKAFTGDALVIICEVLVELQSQNERLIELLHQGQFPSERR